jgi:RNA polymerase sigma factor (sigma-70 family)
VFKVRSEEDAMNKEERDRLIVEHLWVPEAVADRLRDRMSVLGRDELIGIATEALVCAAETFDPTKSMFGTYAFLCCYRKVRSFIDYAMRRAKVQYECISLFPLDGDSRFSNNNNIEEVDREEYFDVLQEKVLEDLKGRDRYIASEFFIQRRKKTEIAGCLGISSQAVDQVVTRIRAKLRVKLRNMKEDY